MTGAVQITRPSTQVSGDGTAPILLCAVAEHALLSRLEAVDITSYLSTLHAFRLYARTPARTAPALAPELATKQPWIAERLVKQSGLTREALAELLTTGSGELADELRAHLLPAEVVDALASAVVSGRAREKRRLAAFAVHLAGVDYAPRRGRETQRGYTKGTITGMVKRVMMLLNGLIEIAADELFEDVVELKRWTTELKTPKIRTHKEAGTKETLTPPNESVIEQIAYYDESLAGIYRRQFGVSDLELTHDDWSSEFHSPEACRNWILRSGILDDARKRALVAVGAETTLRSVGLHDMRWSGFVPEFRHSVLTPEKSADQLGGAVHAIAIKGQPARPKPISSHAVRRVLVYKWMVEALIAPATLDQYPDLTMWCRVDESRVPHSFGQDAINDLFGTHKSTSPKAKNPHKYVLCPMDPAAVRDVNAPREGAGHHGLRRAGDQIIFDYFDRWKKPHDRIRPGLEGAHVKEAALDHTKIPGDVLGYTGLRGESARLLLSYYGSRTIAAVLYEGLSLPRGRDESAIRGILLDLQALNQLAPTAADVREESRHSRANSWGASEQHRRRGPNVRATRVAGSRSRSRATGSRWCGSEGRSPQRGWDGIALCAATDSDERRPGTG